MEANEHWLQSLLGNFVQMKPLQAPLIGGERTRIAKFILK